MTDRYDSEKVKDGFKDHVPQYQRLEGEDGLVIEHLIHKNPKGGFYWAHYVRVGSTLFVRGDMYEATYSWSGSVDMAWIAGCDLGYFQGKVKAIPVGSDVDWRFDAWYEDAAREQLEYQMEEFGSKLTIDNVFEKTSLAAYIIASQDEWCTWLHDNDYEDGDTRLLFPGYENLDCESLDTLHSIGRDTSVICAQHFYALQDAMQKLSVSKDTK